MSVEAYRGRLLPLREAMRVRNTWLRERLETILPELMAREGIDLWLVAAREYNEDPVIMTLLPEPAMAARRRTILLLYRRPDGTVERLSVDRYGYGDLYERAWDPDRETQHECLARLVRERDPQTIGLNVAETFAFGDGLTHSEYNRIADALGPELMARAQGAERLCVGWLERRTPAELAAYPAIAQINHALIAEAFSGKVIHPGITTTDDVVWWFRQKMHDLGLQAWFHPTVEIQAPGQSFKPVAAREKIEKREVIMPGDLLHCDVGFYYLGLATDHQQHAYVLRPGESDAPQGLKDALREGNRLQDILLESMVITQTGNEVLRNTRERARSEGLQPQVYSHPLGYHGHGAGPTIGLWDRQEGVPGQGDYPLFADTCYAIELNVKKAVPEWGGQVVRIALEEDAALTADGVEYLDGRQTALHLI
jgi:hypothetical protein